MKNYLQIKKLTLTALFTAVAVVGSMFSFPVLGSKCAPVQHLVNVLCAVTVGPWWGLAQAFMADEARAAGRNLPQRENSGCGNRGNHGRECFAVKRQRHRGCRSCQRHFCLRGY